LSDAGAGLSPWRLALSAAAAFAIVPAGAGVVLRSAAGPVREAWLAALRSALGPEAPCLRILAAISDDNLIGGLDIAATLRSGRPVPEYGIAARADGGVLLLAMAERVPPATAARLASILDARTVSLQRDGFACAVPSRIGLVLLDESLDDEAPPAALVERCAYLVNLEGISTRDIEQAAFTTADIGAARARLPGVQTEPDAIEALVVVAAKLGVASLRAPLFALNAARALAALDRRPIIEGHDLALAAALTLAPRATRLPSSDETDELSEAEDAPEEIGESRDADAKTREADALEDIVLAAAKAAIPLRLLETIAFNSDKARSEKSGKAGAERRSARRGRPLGARLGSPREGRLSLIATLRAAAPWQPLRRREAAFPSQGLLYVRPGDFRITQRRQRQGVAAIFVVDCSGSAAMHRLAETKGAIELLLADCYVRRDRVALIAFRGQRGEVVLPPTGSTARAKRRLAGLPGGGGTPLASGLETATALAAQVRRSGQSPLVVLMTDGRANVALDGAHGRTKAYEDALGAARRLFAMGISAIAIDTSETRGRERPPTLELAQAMRARYVKLPKTDAAAVNAAVRAAAPSAGR
jgi:magnesium chelatase subunit D